MSLDQEFELNDGEQPAAAEDQNPSSQSDPERQPLVVIQYRNRGIPSFLIPPALVLLSAGVIMSYQRQTPLRALAPPPGSSPSQASANPAPEAAQPALSRSASPTDVAAAAVAQDKPAKADPNPLPTYEPIVVGSEAIPSPAPEPIRPPPAPAKPAAKEVPPAVVASPAPKPAAVVAAASPKPVSSVPTPSPVSTPAASPASLFELGPDQGLRKVDAPSSPSPRLPAETKPAAVNPAELKSDVEPPHAVAHALLPRPSPPPAIGFNVPAAGEIPKPAPAPAPAARPVPEVTKEEIDQDIQREAHAKAAERQEIEAIKPRGKLLEWQEAIRRADSQRVPFRNELRHLLRSASVEEASAKIDDLCEQYGRTTLPAIREEVDRTLRRASSRTSLEDTVAMLRQRGMPEPMILDHLAGRLHERMLNTRNGPRTEDHVRVRAAKLLLSYSAPKAKDASKSRAESATSPTPAGGQTRHPQ